MNKIVKRIIIAVLVLFIGYNVYKVVAPRVDSNATPTSSNGLLATSPENTTSSDESISKLLNLLLSVNNIKISNEIFTSTEFRTLKDFSLSDEEQKLDETVGRNNPFLPIGTEVSNGANENINTQIQAGGSIQTNPVTSSSKDGALFVGENSYTNTSEQYFEWGTSPSDLTQKTPTVAKSSTKTYTYQVNGLTPNTMYYYRGVVKLTDGKIQKGNVVAFKTGVQ